MYVIKQYVGYKYGSKVNHCETHDNSSNNIDFISNIRKAHYRHTQMIDRGWKIKLMAVFKF